MVSWGEFMSGLLANASAGGGGSDVREQMKAFLLADGNTKDQETYTMGTFERLGLFSNERVPQAGNLLDALCELMEEKLAYEDGERDMVLLSHDFLAEWPDGSQSRPVISYLSTARPFMSPATSSAPSC